MARGWLVQEKVIPCEETTSRGNMQKPRRINQICSITVPLDGKYLLVLRIKIRDQTLPLTGIVSLKADDIIDIALSTLECEFIGE